MTEAETGWLIENTLGGCAIWWRGTPVCGLAWTTDSNEAVRFARKQDAERVRDALRDVCGEAMRTAIVTDHMWCPPLDVNDTWEKILPPETATAAVLDAIAENTGPRRITSNEQSDATPQWNRLWGHWEETDEQFRKRLRDS